MVWLILGIFGCGSADEQPAKDVFVEDTDLILGDDDDDVGDDDDDTVTYVQTELILVLAGPYARYAASYDGGVTWPVDFQDEVDDGDGHSEGLIRGCAFGDGLFGCVGGDMQGTYRVSSDGENWTDPLIGTRGWVADVAYGDGRFVSVGGFGNLAWSLDGSRWNEEYRDYDTHSSVLDAVEPGHRCFAGIQAQFVDTRGLFAGFAAAESQQDYGERPPSHGASRREYTPPRSHLWKWLFFV